jgi:hypothetical protein
MTKRKRRLPPEERGGSITWQDEQRVAYGFPGHPRSYEVYQKQPFKLLYRFDDEYGMFFQCKGCRIPHVLLWRDYYRYIERERQSGAHTAYYKVLCVDGGPRLQLARSDDQIEGRVTCVYRIEGNITNEAFFVG